MKLISHHDTNILLEHLINDYTNTKQDLGAFGEYTIAVPNKSIQSWLEQKLVEKIGICSGIRFTSLYRLLHDFQKKASQDNDQIINKEVLSASLYKIFSAIANRQDSEEIKEISQSENELLVINNWLAKQNLDESLASLCYLLADQFELYQIYRSEWLDAWAKGETVLDRMDAADNEPACNKTIHHETEIWQAALWRLIVKSLPNNSILHRKQLSEKFKSGISKDVFNRQLSSFKQVMIFGVNQIDDESIQQLKLINQTIPVTYLWQPASMQLFGSQTDSNNNKQIVENGEAYFEGNSLLAAWGNTSREQSLIFEKNSIVKNKIEEEHYIEVDHAIESVDKLKVENKGANILGSIQQVIKNNIGEASLSTKSLNQEQDSELDNDRDRNQITIVSHFSRYREVEGLYDYLLEQFNQDKEKKNCNKLNPNDILILCPDINAYAPYIRSVFENQKDTHKIPYQICGMNQHKDDVSTLMLQLITLPQTRYVLSDIIDLLNHNHIKQNFDFTTEDVEQFHLWLDKANVSWGLDKKTLRQLELPEYARYTLESGIDRLVLGLTLDGKSLQLDESVYKTVDKSVYESEDEDGRQNTEEHENTELLLGIEGISALQSNLLSKLISFVDQLKHWRDVCINDEGQANTYTIKQWCEHLRRLTEQMIAVPHKDLDSLHSWYQLITSIEKYHSSEGIENVEDIECINGSDDDSLNVQNRNKTQSETQSETQSDSKYTFAYLLSILNSNIEELANTSGAYRFGRLNIGTFGALKGIPAKVVGILGLNESDFPRKQKSDSTDLLLTNHKLGDRNRIEQDKDAFLMALLNCQNKFYCSFVGTDIRSNSERIPSLVLQELLDYIEPDQTKQKSFIQYHPMKAYSSKYFDGESSLSTFQNFDSKESLLPGVDVPDVDELGVDEPGINDSQLDKLPPWDMPEQISIQSLKAFLEDPAKEFFKQRFNVILPSVSENASDEEPLATDKLTEWKFINELLEQGMALNGIDEALIASVGQDFCASGLMPNDLVADKSIKNWTGIATEIFENAILAKGKKQIEIEPVSIDLSVAGQQVKLVGELLVYADEKESNLIHLNHKDTKDINDKYLMRAIVETKVAEAMKLENKFKFNSTVLACKNDVFQLVADSGSAKNGLETWLGLYKDVMNAPIALDLSIAKKLSSNQESIDSNGYRETFDNVIGDAVSSFNGSGLSEAMNLLLNDDRAVEKSESFVSEFNYLKPGKEPEEDSLTPYWLSIKEDLENGGD